MLELRKDPIIGRWVIISTERGKRPTDFEECPKENNSKICPFCVGNEKMTPHEIMSFRDSISSPNKPGWEVRVVPNNFPALQIEGKLQRQADGIYDKMSGIGAHEVIIETPDHGKSLADLSLTKFAKVLAVYKDRILDLEKDRRFRYVLVFKNHGRAAGASLSHSHSQLIAMPIVPKRVIEELKGAKLYFNYKERCIFCDIVEQEIKDKERLIEENDEYLAISPYAPRFPFETWILPKSHTCSFEKTSSANLMKLAQIFSSTLKRLNYTLENPPYNFLIHNAPFSYKDPDSFHWHIEVMPRYSEVAGFEWGTGFYINPTPPEEAATYLREVVF